MLFRYSDQLRDWMCAFLKLEVVEHDTSNGFDSHRMHELITRIQCKGEVTFTVPLDQEVVARVKQFPKQILLLFKLVM